MSYCCHHISNKAYKSSFHRRGSKNIGQVRFSSQSTLTMKSTVVPAKILNEYC